MGFLRFLLGKLLPFYGAGFTYENNGWISRDPFTNEWIYWSDPLKGMFRKRDGEKEWRPSNETRRECLALGKAYAHAMDIV